MENKEPIYIRESGLRFTHILIKKVGKMHQSQFEYDFQQIEKHSILSKMIPCTLFRKTTAECIEYIESFFKTKLKESEYTIKSNI